MKHTLAGPLMSAGLAAILTFPAWSAIPEPPSRTTNSRTTQQRTDVNYHDTNRTAEAYSTNILGLATWTGPGADAGFENQVTYNNQVHTNTDPRASSEVRQAYDDARSSVQQTLASTGGRGQIQFNEGRVSVVDSLQSSTVETGRTATGSDIYISSVGRNSVFIGDADGGNSAFNVVAGSVDVAHIAVTTLDVNRTVTDTTTHNITYVVSGNLYSSPIVLDLKGSGTLEASGGEWLPHPLRFHSKHRVMFDFYGNGFPVAMEWVGPNDALLVQPKADGSVDGSCLFGNANGFNHGYEQMATLDSNLDGHLSGRELAGLSVWQDRNGNARCDAGELQSLGKLGITELNLAHRNFRSSFTRNGKQQAMFDWWPTMFEVQKVQRSI